MPTSQGFRGLRVAFKLAMEIYNESKHFPPEEKYSLTDQIRRASRSVATNIGEGSPAVCPCSCYFIASPTIAVSALSCRVLLRCSCP